MRVLVAVVLLLASCVGPALSFSTGAPQEACTTATPNHPTAPQNTSNPYRIDLSVFEDDGGGDFTYLPGRSYQLTLSAAGNSPTFRGFFIQGRLVADDSPMGAFVDPPAGVRFTSCDRSNSAVTHNSSSEKGSITVSWIAPPAGTGAVRFVYAVVQTYNIYWANDTTSTIQGGNCEVPFYESSGVCVETCPQNEFGNHTSGQCEPYPVGFTASLNATIYVANITADTPFGTPVIYLSAVIGNPDFNSVFLSLVGTGLVDRVFNFPNGGIEQQYSNLIPDVGSNNITVTTQIQYVDDPRNTQPGSDPVTLPATYGMNINLVAFNFRTQTTVERAVRAFVTVDPPPDPCQPNPCTNGGMCNASSTTNYTCTCPPDYTDTNCEVTIDDCVGVDCGNGTCVDGVESFACMCLAGFTGTFCDVNIDECETTGCVNGECTDLINAFQCDCYPGWTGARCEVDIDYCQPRPCSTAGSLHCNDRNTTYTCDCVFGFTGSNCSQDIDECESMPALTGEPACFNDGNCTNLLFGRFECNCPSDYSGDRCETDITPCDPNPCENGGTCEQSGLDFMCNCPPGYTGSNCSIEINECMSDPCDNGGTCVDAVNGFICQCPMGYTGAVCDVDENFCTNETCQNNGTCIEGPGIETVCVCAGGFSGSNCSTDLSFCTPTTCMNDGTCTEGLGIETICECASGFSGSQCESDLSFCQADSCLNGGTCFEEAGEQTRCECHPDFTSPDCSVLSEPCGDSLYYYSGECTAECPDGHYGNHTTSLCSPFPDDYRVILNATRYTALVTTDTRDGEPVMTFTVFINNTYFQLPRAVIFQIETNTNASFTFEDREGSDVLTFNPNFDSSTYPVLKISKQIVYGGTQPAQAGEYDGELTVIVVNQEGTEVRLQNAVLQFTITTGDDTTDVSPTQEPTVRFTIVWIIVGAVALVVLIVVIFSIVFLLGFLYSRKRKGTDTLDINTGRSNRSNRSHSHTTSGSHTTRGSHTTIGSHTTRGSHTTIPLEVTDIAAAVATTTTSFTVSDFSIVISNPSPEHLSEEEGAQHSTRNRVPAPEDEQPPAPEDEQPPAPEDEQPPTPEDEQPPAPEDEQPPAPEDEQPPAPKDKRPPAPEDEQPPSKEPDTT